MYGSVLEHLGIDAEVGYLGAVAQSAQHGICTAAHTTLQVQEGAGNLTALEVSQQEVGYVLANLVGNGVGILEGTCLIGDITLYHTDNTVGIHLNVGLADAVTGLRNHDGGAVRVVLNLIDVVNAHAAGFVEGVQLDDDTLCSQTAYGGADAAGCGQVDMSLVAHLLDGAGLDDGPVDIAQVALANLSGHVREIQVAVSQLV